MGLPSVRNAIVYELYSIVGVDLYKSVKSRESFKGAHEKHDSITKKEQDRESDKV